MAWNLIILRIIHILSGVSWAGAVIFLTLVFQPAVDAGGPEAGRFMQRLASHRRFRTFMAITPTLTFLSGLALMGAASAGFQRAWIATGTGTTLAIGSVATLLVFVVFGVVQRPALERLQALGADLQRSGGAPTSAQAAQLQALQQRMRGAGVWSTALLTIAVLAMASARYVHF